jgi:RNA polymerase sigma-70 factor (ECF subfamily)
MVIGADFDSVLGAAQAGAEWAFAVLYRDLNPRLVRYFAAQAPSVADDLASETWLAVAGRLRSFRGGEGALRGWLFAIARRRLIQHWRDARRHPGRPVPTEMLTDEAGPDDTEAAVLDADSARSAMRAIIQLLSADQADVVLLRVLADLDVGQVAEILGKRPGTVRVLQHKALRRLAAKSSLEVLTQ